MTKIDGNNEPRTAFARAQAGLSNEGAGLETLAEGIKDHVAFFVDVVESRRRIAAGEGTGPVVTVESTVEGLKLLGCDPSATGVIGLGGLGRNNKANQSFGGLALTGVFAKRQGHGFGGVVETERLAEVGIRGTRDGINADTGTFRKGDGSIDVEKAVAFFAEVAGKKGYATLGDLKAYFASGSYPGKMLNELELRLAFDLFGQIQKDGTKIFTAAHWAAFIDGSAWAGLAQARADGVLYRPTGELKHDGAKQIAKQLAKLTGTYGGLTADAGTAALYGAAGAIDSKKSLEDQQKMKNLGATLGGALMLLCPFKGMFTQAKPAAQPA